MQLQKEARMHHQNTQFQKNNRNSTAIPNARTSPSLISTPLLGSHLPNPSANGMQLDVENAAQTRSVFAGLLGFCQHPTFALHPPCKNHEHHCESTFPHGCVVEPFAQAHLPLYLCLAYFDKVQSGETPGSIQRTMERNRWKLEKSTKKHGGWSGQSFLVVTKKYAVDHKKTPKKHNLFPTPRCRRFQRFGCIFHTLSPVPNGQKQKICLLPGPFQGSQSFDLEVPKVQDTCQSTPPARDDRYSSSEITAQTWTFLSEDTRAIQSSTFSLSTSATNPAEIKNSRSHTTSLHILHRFTRLAPCCFQLF